MTSLAALPHFLAYLGVSILVLAVFLVIYTWMTRHNEWDLIRRGNTAASVSLSGALIGFSLPLASVIAHAGDFADLVVWALVAMVVQLIAYFLVNVIASDVSAAIERGQMAQAVMLGTGGVVMGILNAACLTY